MSRVEPKDERDQVDRREESRNERGPRESAPSPTPTKAEGEERDVERALGQSGRDREH